MKPFTKAGFFILSLKDGTVLSARHLEVLPEGIKTSIGGIETLIKAEELAKSWQLSGELPLAELEHFSNLGAALVSFEGALTRYSQETGSDPFTNAHGPVMFDATSLAFTLAPFRSSQDIDLAVSQEFVEWTMGNWNPPLEVGVDLCTEELLDLCGRWRTRTTIVTGLSGVKFRLLHPLDVVSQKLLRRSEDTFSERDALDIECIVSRINPTKASLIALLAESPHRYNPTPQDPMVPSQHDAVIRNTTWFLNRFIPGVTIDQIAEAAWTRRGEALTDIGLAPASGSLADRFT